MRPSGSHGAQAKKKERKKKKEKKEEKTRESGQDSPGRQAVYALAFSPELISSIWVDMYAVPAAARGEAAGRSRHQVSHQSTMGADAFGKVG